MSETIKLTRDEIEPMLRAAYLRGAEWHRINGMDIGYIAKAAGDYADATCTVTFASEINALSPPPSA